MSMKRMSKTKTMKHAKKTLCCLLAGCMLAGMMPSAAVAETGEPTAPEIPPTAETPTTPEIPTAAGTSTVAATPAAIEIPSAPADGDEAGISLLSGAESTGVFYCYDTTDELTGERYTKTETITEYTAVESTDSGATWSTGWYVVDSDVTINGSVTFTGEVYLILCDGAKLTVNGGITSDENYTTMLTIYGQTNNTGKLNVTNEKGMGIYAYRGFTVYGGVIEATGNAGENGYSCGIYGDMGAIVVVGGSVTGNGGSGTNGSYGIYGSLRTSGGTIHGTHAETDGDSADIYGYVRIRDGRFTSDVIGLFTEFDADRISGGTFERQLIVSGNGKVVTDLLADGYVFQKADETAPIRWDDVKNLKTIENVAVVPCPHSAKEDGTCCYCGATLEARNETTKTVYTHIFDALEKDATETGDTVTMLADAEGVSTEVVVNHKGIKLDLNGKTLTNLGVYGEPLTITDSKGGGRIVNLETINSINKVLNISNLLAEGWVFRDGSGNWYDATHNADAKKATNVSVRPQPTLTLAPESSSQIYGCEPSETTTISAAVSGADDITVTYAWYLKKSSDSTFTLQDGATGSSFSFPEGKAAGDYEVKCEANCDGYTLEQTVTVTVARANVSYTAPIAKSDLSYNGLPQALVTKGTTNDGTMQYQLDGGAWDTQIPAADKAGTYRIRYKVVGDANHNDTAEAELTVTIAKATPVPDAPLTASVTYGDAVNNTDIKGSMNAGGSNVDGSFVWENVSTYGDATGDTPRTLYATFKPADTTNYNYAEHLSVAVTVDKATYGTQTAAGSAKYGASNTLDLSGLIMSGGTAAVDTTAISDSKSILDGTPSISGTMFAFAFKDTAVVDDTATVLVKVTDCTNYKNYTITVTLTVNDTNVPTVTAPAAKMLTYNGADQQLIEAAQTTGGTLQYKLGESGTWSAELPKAKNAGTYTVYYKVIGNTDYADVPEASVPATIAKKNVTVKPKSYSITQGNAIPRFTLEYDGLVAGDTLTLSGTPAFTCTEADGTTAVSTQTAAGTYTITWTNAADLDFTKETNYAVTKASTGTLMISAKPSSSGSGGYSGGGASGGAPAPTEKPTDKPDQKPSNKPTLDRTELLEMTIRLPYQILSRLPLFSHLTWTWLWNFKLFK